MTTAANSGLLFIADERGAARCADAIAALAAQRADADTLRGVVPDPDRTLVLDVDLRNLGTVRRLRELLPVGDRHGCRIFVVAPRDRVAEVHARALGADVLLHPPVTPAQVHRCVMRHVGLGTTPADAALAQSVADGAAALDRTFAALIEGSALDGALVADASAHIADAIAGRGVEDWLAAVRGYHAGTFRHCLIVTGVATAFGTRTGMSRRDVTRLSTAGILHDIGKAEIPLAILDKPGKLTEAEFAVIRTHPEIGDRYLAAHSDIDDEIRRCVRHHHEYLDGSGYPDGLAGGRIDDLTRILTICDIYGALIERRSYRAPRSPRQALEVLEDMAAAGKVELSLVRALGKVVGVA